MVVVIRFLLVALFASISVFAQASYTIRLCQYNGASRAPIVYIITFEADESSAITAASFHLEEEVLSSSYSPAQASVSGDELSTDGSYAAQIENPYTQVEWSQILHFALQAALGMQPDGPQPMITINPRTPIFDGMSGLFTMPQVSQASASSTANYDSDLFVKVRSVGVQRKKGGSEKTACGFNIFFERNGQADWQVVAIYINKKGKRFKFLSDRFAQHLNDFKKQRKRDEDKDPPSPPSPPSSIAIHTMAEVNAEVNSAPLYGQLYKKDLLLTNSWQRFFEKGKEEEMLLVLVISIITFSKFTF